MKTKSRTEAVRLLRECIKLLDETSDDEFERFMNGTLTLAFVPCPKKTQRPGTTKEESRIGSSSGLEELVVRLQKSTSREEALRLLQSDEGAPGKVKLLHLSRLLQVHINKYDQRETIEDKIVEAVIGVRLRSEAIRDVNLKGSSVSTRYEQVEPEQSDRVVPVGEKNGQGRTR